MNVRRHMPLLIGGGLCLVLLGVAAYVLLRYRGDYLRVRQELESSLQRLERLNQRDPFPSEENVAVIQKNLEVLKGFHNSLVEKIRSGQVEADDMEPAEFKQFLESTLSDLREQARGKVILPARFGFGFDRYVKGALPAPEHIPRLTVQLKTVEVLCRLLFDARVSRVTAIERDRFEQAAEGRQTPAAEERGRRGRRRRRQPEPAQRERAKPEEQVDSLYAEDTFTLEFLASESALWGALDALARSDLMCVVSDVELRNEQPQPPTEAAVKRESADTEPRRPPAGPLELFAEREQEPAAPKEPPTHDERVVAGRERVVARVEVDVIRLEEREETSAEETAP